MNKFLLLLSLCTALLFSRSQAQTIKPDVTQKRLTDSVCNCLTRIDTAKVTNQQQAIAAYTDCMAKHVGLLQTLATERHLNINDKAVMDMLGIELAQSLIEQNCDGFTSLSGKMGIEEPESTTGTFKRIDIKGFNYIVIKDGKGAEQSFIWLRRFPGAEKFIKPTARLIGKKIKISWQEMEVYVPQAKAYRKVREIIRVDFL